MTRTIGMPKRAAKKTTPRNAGRRRQKRADPMKPQDSRIVFVQRPTSGIRVDHYNAQSLSTVWSCVGVVSESLASMHLDSYERLKDGGKQTYDGNDGYLLACEPNEEMSAFAFTEMACQFCLTWGNSLAEIEPNRLGRPAAYWPITWDRVRVDRDENGKIVYLVMNPHEADSTYYANEVLHFHGRGFDGLVGYSVIRMAAKSIGLGMAMQESGEAFFGNGT